MIFGTDPLSDLETQWFIYYNDILLKFSTDTRVKLATHYFIHNLFINLVTKGGQDDR
jgi:hypothetical protein